MRRARFRQDERGATLVEFALIAPLLLGVMLAALQVGVLEMVSSNFNNAVVVAARRIRTGQSDGAQTAAAFKGLICDSMIDAKASCLARLQVDVRRFSRFADAAASAPDPSDRNDTFTAGAAGDIMLVTATYRWPMVTPFLGEAFPRADAANALISAHTLFKNEPYA
ncbi:MAG: hypothetical protein JWQ97_1960 [Phenylobacterium sp.]|nr:hypothetical protein [Phenylobacterium sp.]